MNLTSIGDKNNHMQTSICSSEEIPVTLENIANLFDFDEVRCLEFSGTWGQDFKSSPVSFSWPLLTLLAHYQSSNRGLTYLLAK